MCRPNADASSAPLCLVSDVASAMRQEARSHQPAGMRQFDQSKDSPHRLLGRCGEDAEPQERPRDSILDRESVANWKVASHFAKMGRRFCSERIWKTYDDRVANAASHPQVLTSEDLVQLAGP